MRFLALQTDVEVLKKQYIPEGEHEIMTVRRHVVPFVMDFIWKTAVMLPIAAAIFMGFSAFSSFESLIISNGLLLIVAFSYIYQIIKSYIAWRYNFLIVTSDKIIIINHRSFLHQGMNSIHLDSITTSKFNSQYLGLVRCGILYLHLQEKEGQGSTRIITIPHIPNPDTVASAIEHAIMLKQQRAKGTETPAVQEQKAEVIKENLKEEVKEAPVEGA